MGKIELLAMKFYKTRFAVDNHPTLLLKVVEAPHVVVACKEMYLYTLVGKFRDLTEETGISLGNSIAELIPEVEHVPEHIHSSGLILDFVKEGHKTALMGTAMLYCPRAKVCIGKEIYLLHGNTS